MQMSSATSSESADSGPPPDTVKIRRQKPLATQMLSVCEQGVKLQMYVILNWEWMNG